MTSFLIRVSFIIVIKSWQVQLMISPRMEEETKVDKKMPGHNTDMVLVLNIIDVESSRMDNSDKRHFLLLLISKFLFTTNK